MASLQGKIAFNTLVSAAGRIFSTVFALAVIGIITRALGQDGFGSYTIVLAYLSLFVIFADFGLQSLMTREISRSDDGAEQIASNFFTLRLISSLIFLSLGFLIVFFFPYSREVQLGVGVGAIGLFFLSVSSVLMSVFQKHLAMHMATLAEVVGRATQLVFVFLVFRLEGGLLEFVWAMSGAAFVILLLNFVFTQKYIKVGLRFDPTYWRRILVTTWPIALSIVLTLIYFKIDTIFLSLMKPEADVGLYGVAYKVLESFIFFPAMFAGIMMPMLSRSAVSDSAEFRSIFNKSIRIIAIFAIPVAFGGWVLSYSIANLIGGEEFLRAGAPMQALFVATAIIFFGNILGRAVIALDLQKKAVIAYLLGVVLNVVLNLVFIPKYTYMGAAWTTVATELLVTLFLFYLIWSRFARPPGGIRETTGSLMDVAGTIKVTISAAIMAGVLLIFVSPITAPLSFLNLGLYTILGGAVYFIVLYLFGGIKRQELLLLFKNR